MQDSTLAKRYAVALADLAVEQEILEAVEGELETFNQVLESTPAVKELLTNPAASSRDQHAALAVYLEKVAPNTITGNFLKLLIDKRRMVIIDSILRAYTRQVESRSGRLRVNVRSAKPLTKTHVNKLQAALSTSSGKEVSVDVEEDENLLGGIVVRIGSLMLDYSVRGRLSRMQAFIKG